MRQGRKEGARWSSSEGNGVCEKEGYVAKAENERKSSVKKRGKTVER